MTLIDVVGTPSSSVMKEEGKLPDVSLLLSTQCSSSTPSLPSSSSSSSSSSTTAFLLEKKGKDEGKEREEEKEEKLRFPLLGEVFQALFGEDNSAFAHLRCTTALSSKRRSPSSSSSSSSSWNSSQRGFFFLSDQGEIIEEVTYRELDLIARSIAYQLVQLQQQGLLQPGDRVCLIYTPSLDFIKALMGCFYARIIAVPIAPHAILGGFARSSAMGTGTKGTGLGEIMESVRSKGLGTSTMLSFLAKLLDDAQPKMIFCSEGSPSASFNIFSTLKMATNALKLGSLFRSGRSIPAVRQFDHSLKFAKVNAHKFDSRLSYMKSLSDNNSVVDARSEIAMLQYSSGSTGDPKAVALTHCNIISQVKILKRAFGIKSRGTTEVGLSWLPFYHDMGLIGHVLVPMYSCGSNYFLSPLSFLRDPLLWPRCLSKYDVGITGGPNFAFALLTSCAGNAIRESGNGINRSRNIEDPLKGVDLSKLRIMFCGAEPISTSVIAKFFSLYSRWGLKETCFLPCYGLAEATLCVTVQMVQELSTRIVVDRVSLETENKVKLLKKTSGVYGEIAEENDSGANPSNRTKTLIGLGKAANLTKVKIVDPETKKEVAVGTVGEIWVSSPSVAGQGYWHREQLSKDTFNVRLNSEPSDNVRYLRTGDLGFQLEEEGELFYASRLKDLIVIAGRKHWPQDVEEVIQDAHPSIRKGCCVAFSVEPTEKGQHGEQLGIVAELRPVKGRVAEALYDKTQLAEIREAVRQSVYQRLQLSLRPELLLLAKPGTVPKTTSGKVKRKETQRKFISGELKKFAYIPKPSSKSSSLSSSEISQEVTSESSGNIFKAVLLVLVKIFLSAFAVPLLGLCIRFSDRHLPELASKFRAATQKETEGAVIGQKEENKMNKEKKGKKKNECELIPSTSIVDDKEPTPSLSDLLSAAAASSTAAIASLSPASSLISSRLVLAPTEPLNEVQLVDAEGKLTKSGVEKLIVGLIVKHSSHSLRDLTDSEGKDGEELEVSSTTASSSASPVAIDVLAALHTFGMSSVEAMAVGTDLERMTKKKLDVTLLFEAESISDLAEAVLKAPVLQAPVQKENWEQSTVENEFFLQRGNSSSSAAGDVISAYIFALATANPKYRYSQEEVFETVLQQQLSKENSENICALLVDAEKARKLFKGSLVGGRHFVRPIEEVAVLNTTGERNQVYVEEAPALAIDAAMKCLEEWGGKKEDITHVIAVSCTGTIVPGIEFHLMNALGLRRSVQRLNIGFMGCFGALAGLRTAQSIALSDPRHRILVVCCELCSLHAQKEEGRRRTDVLVAEAIFGDGAAACIVGASEENARRRRTRIEEEEKGAGGEREEKAIYRLSTSACFGSLDTMDRIRWDLGDTGWKVGLGVDITQHLVEALPNFVSQLVKSSQSEDESFFSSSSSSATSSSSSTSELTEYQKYHWAIHPGGRAIVDAIEKTFALKQGQLSSTRTIMETLGNMSSPTVLFVLDHLRRSHLKEVKEKEGAKEQEGVKKEEKEKKVISLAFGPGLATEGVVLSLL